MTGDSTQNRAIEALRSIAKENGLETTVDYGYANTGTLYGWMEGSLDKPVVELTFSFHGGYGSFTIRRPLSGVAEETLPFVEFAKGELQTRLLTQWESAIKEELEEV